MSYRLLERFPALLGILFSALLAAPPLVAQRLRIVGVRGEIEYLVADVGDVDLFALAAWPDDGPRQSLPPNALIIASGTSAAEVAVQIPPLTDAERALYRVGLVIVDEGVTSFENERLGEITTIAARRLDTFARDVHTSLFASAPGEYPMYECLTPFSGVGIYPAASAAGEACSLEVLGIEVPAADVAAAEIAISDFAVSASARTWSQQNGFEATVIRAKLRAGGAERDIIATVLAWSVDPATAPAGRVSFFGVSDDPAFYDAVLLPFAPPAASFDDLDAVGSILPDCDGEIVVDQACIDAALAAYDAASQLAIADWQQTIDGLVAAYFNGRAAYQTARTANLAYTGGRLAQSFLSCAAFTPTVAGFAGCVGGRIAVRATIGAARAALASYTFDRLVDEVVAREAEARRLLEAAAQAAADQLLADLQGCIDCIPTSGGSGN
jgi:hypothetical protein